MAVIIDPEVRYVFPTDGDRLVYQVPLRRGAAITSARDTQFRIWTSPEKTQWADIQTLDGTPIPNSIVTADQHSRIPQFLGPPGAISLWMAGPWGTFEINARFVEGPPGPPGPPGGGGGETPTVIDGGGPDTVYDTLLDGGNP